ncbi:MAG: metal ABC transporter permease [Archaeoglobaceae archaeon]
MHSIVAAVATSLLASLAGSISVFRKSTFLVAASAHAALAGASLAVMLNSFGVEVDELLVTLLFATLMTAMSARISKEPDVGASLVFAISMGLAALFLSLSREKAAVAWNLLFGDLMLLGQREVAALAVAASVVAIVFAASFSDFLFVAFDREGAEVYGVNCGLVDLAAAVIVAVSTVAALRAVGAVLIYALFVAPAAASLHVSRSVGQSIALSFAIALLSLILGVAASYALKISASAAAAIVASLVYLSIYKARTE